MSKFVLDEACTSGPHLCSFPPESLAGPSLAPGSQSPRCGWSQKTEEAKNPEHLASEAVSPQAADAPSVIWVKPPALHSRPKSAAASCKCFPLAPAHNLTHSTPSTSGLGATRLGSHFSLVYMPRSGVTGGITLMVLVVTGSSWLSSLQSLSVFTVLSPPCIFLSGFPSLSLYFIF